MWISRSRLTSLILSGVFGLLALMPYTTYAQVKFRNPLNIVPTVSAYFDNNIDPTATLTYWCAQNSALTYQDHRGTDLSSAIGTSVYAGAQGTPYLAKSDCATTNSPSCGGGFGNYVVMDHEGNGTDGVGMASIYAHMSQYSPISQSTPLACASYLGQTGSSGTVSGPHLHFELRPNGFAGASRLDPFGYAGSCSQSTSYWYATSGSAPSITPSTQCQPVPLWPTNLSVTNPSGSTLQINFRDNALDETYIYVERKTGTSGAWAAIAYFNALTGTNNWNWTNGGLATNQTYCYRLRAQNAYGYSVYSNEACGTTLSVATVPLAPSAVSVSNATINSLRVNFKDNATNETNVVMERKIGVTGSWSTIATFNALSGASNWYWVNTGLSSRVTYCYRLKATNSVGSSPYSNEACGTTL